jgi:hypothetical protein
MKAFAWRRETDNNKANYCLQVENIKGYTVIFSSDFDNPHKWQAWAEEFPIYLVELTSHGNEKLRNKKLVKAGAVL